MRTSTLAKLDGLRRQFNHTIELLPAKDKAEFRKIRNALTKAIKSKQEEAA